MIEARKIEKAYEGPDGALPILRGIDLELGPGRSASLMGPSGSGKSTFLNILGTLERPTSGTLLLDGSDPFALGDKALATFRNRSIGFVFQEHHLLPQCSVLENIMIPTLAGRDGPGGIDTAKQLAESVGLAERIEHRPGELSGGERQRVAIARALIHQPKLVLADEPTGNLDRSNADVVAELLGRLCREHGITLVVATHSENLADRFDDRYELIDGRLSPRNP